MHFARLQGVQEVVPDLFRGQYAYLTTCQVCLAVQTATKKCCWKSHSICGFVQAHQILAAWNGHAEDDNIVRRFVRVLGASRLHISPVQDTLMEPAGTGVRAAVSQQQAAHGLL